MTEEDRTVHPLGPYTDSFEAFVAARGPSLVRTAYLLTGDRHLAEDLVQTVLAKAASRFDAIAGRGDPTAYVRQMVVRSVIGWRRRRWHGEVPAAVLPDVAGVDAIGGADERDRLRRALAELPSRQRAAVVLRFYEDLSEAETARALGCSTGTVKSQTSKGLAKIRERLGIAEPDPPFAAPNRRRRDPALRSPR